MNKPIVSIIIPCYNRSDLIPSTLNSIKEQTYSDWECIIVDDQSTDAIYEVITPFLRDSRFNFFIRNNGRMKGANSCRNIGLEKSIGKYVYWLDSDDILHPNALEICMDKLQNSNFDFCRFERSIFVGSFDKKSINNTLSSNGFIVNSSHIEKLLKNELVFNTCNLLWNKESIGNQRFNENIVYADEWEFYSRLLSENLEGINIDKILIYARKHIGSTTYEYWNKNPIRLQSKKEAIRLVTENLAKKNLLSESLVKYLIGLVISFRDYNLLKELFSIMRLKPKNVLFIKFKYYMFPVWKIYKHISKINK